MQNKNGKNIIFFKLQAIALITVLFLVGGASAAEKEKDAKQSSENKKVFSKRESKNKKKSKAPSTFVPTDKVTADQAVAFPSDI